MKSRSTLKIAIAVCSASTALSIMCGPAIGAGAPPESGTSAKEGGVLDSPGVNQKSNPDGTNGTTKWLTFAATDVNAARYYNRVRIVQIEAIVETLSGSFTDSSFKAKTGITIEQYQMRVKPYVTSPVSIKASTPTKSNNDEDPKLPKTYIFSAQIQQEIPDPASPANNRPASNGSNNNSPDRLGTSGRQDADGVFKLGYDRPGEVTHESPLFLGNSANTARVFDDYARLYGGAMFLPNTGTSTFIFVGSAPVNRHDVIRPNAVDHVFHPDPADPDYVGAAPDFVYANDFYENWAELHRSTAHNPLTRLKQTIEIEPFIGLSTKKISDAHGDDSSQVYMGGISIIINPYINFPAGVIFSNSTGKDHLRTRLGIGIGIDLGTLTTKLFSSGH